MGGESEVVAGLRESRIQSDVLGRVARRCSGIGGSGDE
jgi:hypothetical protein